MTLRILLCLVALLFATSAVASAYTVPQSWTFSGCWVDTGIYVNAGQVIHVHASGSWSSTGSAGFCGPDGSTFRWFDQWLNPNNLGDGRPDGSGVPSVTDHFGALIGYIGPNALTPSLYGNCDRATRLNCVSRIVLLGSDVTVTAPVSGKLWLGMNDDAYGGNVSDNAGSITASVSVVPEPSCLAALLAGTAGLGLRRATRSIRRTRSA